MVRRSSGTEGETDVALGIQAEIAHHLRMHLAGTGDLQPAAAVRPRREHHVDFGGRFGEGKNDGRKRTTRSSLSKKQRRKSVYTPFRSAKEMSSAIQSPSTWWNMGECVASLSTR